jgi:hypothetical protein
MQWLGWPIDLAVFGWAVWQLWRSAKVDRISVGFDQHRYANPMLFWLGRTAYFTIAVVWAAGAVSHVLLGGVLTHTA